MAFGWGYVLGDLSILKHYCKYSFRWLTSLTEPTLPPVKDAFVVRAACAHGIVGFTEAEASPCFHAFVSSGFLLL